MGRRGAVPLYKTRHAAFVEAILESDASDKSMASHLAVGTGGRAYTITHTHSSWFIYERDGALYYRIPKSGPCYKYGDTSPCGDCNMYNHDEYEPKTEAGEGRRILIKNEWTNPATNEREYFGLRDAVESYFALDGPHSPDGVQHGNKMLGGDGISKLTLNKWLRDIGAQSSISSTHREDQIRETLTLDEEDERERDEIVQFGKDDDGNQIPDLISHDMRATFCTQLMRNDVTRSKAINKTGHKNPEAMEPYVSFAEGEISEEEETEFY